MQFLLLLVLFTIHEDTQPPLPDTAPIRFAKDELDRVAILHNRDVRPTYVVCQNLVNDYYNGLMTGSHTVGNEQTKSLDQLQIIGKLRHCASRLKEATEDLLDKMDDFSDAVGDLE